MTPLRFSLKFLHIDVRVNMSDDFKTLDKSMEVKSVKNKHLQAYAASCAGSKLEPFLQDYTVVVLKSYCTALSWQSVVTGRDKQRALGMLPRGCNPS